MHKKDIDVSIIIVSFNTLKLTSACIESVFEYTKGVRYEVIVIDNNSTDGSVSYFQKLAKRKKITFINNTENVGFASANNQGFKIAKGSSFLLLNSDTKLESDAISSVFHTLFSSPQVGIASCALRNENGTVQASGGYFPTISRLFTWMFFVDDLPLIGPLLPSYHPKLSYFSNKHRQEWITGAFFMIKRTVVDSVGGFDPDYFMYVEEMDFCFRASKKGFAVLFDPADHVIHYGQASGSSKGALIQELKNLTVFYKKHKPSQYLLSRVIIKFGSLARMILFAILGRGQLSKTYAEAFSKI